MPASNPAPPIALIGQFDARQWASVTVFKRGATNVTVSASAGIFDDLLDFLNGRGSSTALALRTCVNTVKTDAGTWTIGIDANDKVYIESDTATFTLAAGTGLEAWGFSSGGMSASNVTGTIYRATAADQWVRGPVVNAYITIDPAGLPAAFSIPSSGGTVMAGQFNDPITAIRNRGIGDADDTAASTCLEAVDTSHASIRWSLTATGHVCCSRRTASTTALTWQTAGKTLRDALGFTGSETETTSGAYSFLTATNLPRVVWAPSTQIGRCRHVFGEKSRTMRTANGAIASANLATWSGWDVELYLDGPDATTPDVEHIWRRWWRSVPVGYGVTLYRHWGDPRRQLYADEVTADQPAYDLLYTSEPERGRKRCRRDPDDEQGRTPDYLGDTFEQQAGVRIMLADRTD